MVVASTPKITAPFIVALTAIDALVEQKCSLYTHIHTCLFYSMWTSLGYVFICI